MSAGRGLSTENIYRRVQTEVQQDAGGVFSAPDAVWECQTCGALVTSFARHDAWHEVIAPARTPSS